MRLPTGRVRHGIIGLALVSAGAGLFVAGAVVRGDGGERRIAVPGPERTVVVEREVDRASPIEVAGAPRVVAPSDRPLGPPLTRRDGSVVEPIRGDDTRADAEQPEPPARDFPTQQATADELVQAWAAGDRAAARQAATQDVVDLLFRQAWSESNRFLGCRRDVSGMVVCSYAEGTGTLGLYVAAAEEGYEVVGIEHTDPE